MGNKNTSDSLSKNQNIKVYYQEKLLYQQNKSNTQQFSKFLKSLVTGKFQ